MAGKWSPDFDPETLAFPIKPRKEEALDSWLDRVAVQHGISRVQLFRHLHIDPELARLDLARGKQDLEPVRHGAFDMLVTRLAWAVEVEVAQITATLLTCDAAALLPRARRHYACAQCWYEAWRSDDPLIVRRDWILRAGWRCRNHGLPLSDMRTVPPGARGRQLWSFLARAGVRSRRILWKIKPSPPVLARNKAVVDWLLAPGDWEGLAPPYPGYQARFTANRYHLAGDRIAMLALAHSANPKAARRFERLITHKLPERPMPGGGVRTPDRQALRLRTCRLPRPKSEWSGDFSSLIVAYGAVRHRREAEQRLEMAFAHFERSDLPPARR